MLIEIKSPIAVSMHYIRIEYIYIYIYIYIYLYLGTKYRKKIQIYNHIYSVILLIHHSNAEIYHVNILNTLYII